MAHKLAEAVTPGSSDEKMGCEVGTYAWMQERCPEIRIPHLYGFGFSDRRHVRTASFTPVFLSTHNGVGSSHTRHRPLYVRAVRHLRRLFHNLIGYPTILARYVCHPTNNLIMAYMLLDDISSDTSQMLSNTWDKGRRDPARRQRLFRGMGRLLSLARIPQPRIVSVRFHDDGI